MSHKNCEQLMVVLYHLMVVLCYHKFNSFVATDIILTEF